MRWDGHCWRVLLLLGTLLKSAGFGQAVPDPATAVKTLAKEASEAERKGDYQAAAERYEEFVRRRPDLPEARSDLGLMYDRLGRYQEAVSSFQTALKQNSQLYTANLFLGLDLLQLQQPRAALPYLVKAERMSPRDQLAVRGLATAHLSLEEPEQANQWYYRATQLNPTDPDSWYGLGVTYWGMQEAAVSALLERGPQSGYARELAAELRVELGQLDDAIRIYQDILRISPQPPCMHEELGFVYIRKGDFSLAQNAFRDGGSDRTCLLLRRLGEARVLIWQERAATALATVISIWETDADFLNANQSRLWVGLSVDQIKALTSEWEHAPEIEKRSRLRSLLENRASLQPTLGPPSLEARARTCTSRVEGSGTDNLSKVAECDFYSGYFHASLMASNNLGRLQPHSLISMYWRAKAAARLAVDALMQAQHEGNDSFRIHLLLGELYRKQGQDQLAVVEYTKAAELRPGDERSYLGLALCYFSPNQYDEAIKELERVFDHDPTQPDANYLMAEILASRQEYEKAMPYIKIALGCKQAERAARAHALLGAAYSTQGRTSEAIAQLKQAVAYDDDGSVNYQLSRLYIKAGDKEAAAIAASRSQAIKQRNIEQAEALMVRRTEVLRENGEEKGSDVSEDAANERNSQ